MKMIILFTLGFILGFAVFYFLAGMEAYEAFLIAFFASLLTFVINRKRIKHN